MATQITSKSSTLDETSSTTTKRLNNVDFLSEQNHNFIFSLNLLEIDAFIQEFPETKNFIWFRDFWNGFACAAIQSYLSALFFFFLKCFVGKTATSVFTNTVLYFGTKLLTSYSIGKWFVTRKITGPYLQNVKTTW